MKAIQIQFAESAPVNIPIKRELTLTELAEAQKQWTPAQWTAWENRVGILEESGLTRSDAQGVADIACTRPGWENTVESFLCRD